MAFPLPLHPGVHIALRRFEFTETDVARAVQAGELASPQMFANSAYFRIRITGTGFAYRPRLKEFVWRDEKIYLGPEFIERCLGLPVVMMHPPQEMLDTDEFAGRIVGTVVRAWIEGEEVWAVARILDLRAAGIMVSEQLSTSPGVVFLGGRPVNEKIKLTGGHQMLVEGNPGLLDHVAICPAGVWDKESGPTGIDIGDGMIPGKPNPGDAGIAEDEAMADTEEKTEDKGAEDKKGDTKRDDATQAVLDAIAGVRDDVKRIDARVDAMEKRHRDDADDPEQEKRQAAELEKLAAEEEAEAAKADGKERDDSRKAMGRRDGESRSAHSQRVDAAAKRHDKGRMGRRDAESEDEHSERMDAFCKDDRKDEVEDVGDLHGKQDAKRDDKRDDRRDAKRGDEAEDKVEDKEEKEKKAESEEDRKDVKRDDGKRDDRKDARRDDKRDDRMRDDARHDSATPEALARAQRDIEANSRMLEQLQRGLDRPADEANLLAEAQSRADSVYSLFGDGKRAPAPNVGETVTGYQVRLARGLQAHSTAWKDEDLLGLSRMSATAFGNAAVQIYADAAVAARKPLEAGGMLRARKRTSETGHQVTEYDGDPAVWMRPFRTDRVGVSRLGLRGQNQ